MEFRRALVFLFLLVTCVTGNTIRKKEKRIRGKIVGGEEVSKKLFMYQAGISHKVLGHFCGGSVIHPQVILTAAHCLTNVSPADTEVITGAQYTRGEDGEKTKALQFIIHPKYNPDTIDYDIALIVLRNAITKGRMIALGYNEPKAGVRGLISGYGVLKAGTDTPSESLQAAWVPIMDKAVCNQIYQNLNPITERMLCAGWKNGKIDACQGDSGGPLVVGDAQVGVISWASGCAKEGRPGVYASIANLLPWIQQYVEVTVAYV